MRKRKTPLWALALVLLLAALVWWQQRDPDVAGTLPSSTETSRDDLETIADAFASQRSDVWVESSGTVLRKLRDDTHGSAHQRFLVELANGQTLLFAHNIDLAPRVPLEPGDRITFRREYEWNDKGGVIHWTHHDPRGRREGGWIDLEGERYR